MTRTAAAPPFVVERLGVMPSANGQSAEAAVMNRTSETGFPHRAAATGAIHA
jgi:hypothetical protein